MSFEGRYTDAERTEAVELYVSLVQHGGMTRRAAGDMVRDRLGPSRATVASWAEEDGALLPPTFSDMKKLREAIAALETQVTVLQQENSRLRERESVDGRR